jgi:hypothetical protein
MNVNITDSPAAKAYKKRHPTTGVAIYCLDCQCQVVTVKKDSAKGLRAWCGDCWRAKGG